jgi:hypothetical protein
MERWAAQHLICSPQTTRAQRAEKEERGDSQQQRSNLRPHLNSHREGSLVLVSQLQHALSARARPRALGHEGARVLHSPARPQERSLAWC